MSGAELVLSVFPGIDLLGRAFEEMGFCVVRGPDVIWGGDIRTFHPPAGAFGGIIGGPPCQAFSALAPLVRHNGHELRFGNLIPEFERVVFEAQPQWFVMENVRGAPIPQVGGYDRWAELVRDCDVGGLQPRIRRISFGMRVGVWPEPLRSPFTLMEFDPQTPSVSSPLAEGGSGIAYEERHRKRSVKADPRPMRREAQRATVLAGHGPAPGQRDAGAGAARTPLAEMLEAQGLPSDYLDDAPFTMDGKRRAVGNGVPMAMGRAIAKMVRAACTEGSCCDG